MSKRSRRQRPAAGNPASSRLRTPTITVCRGCCCGTLGKHPEVDHDEQLDQLRAIPEGTARVRVSDCLDHCERSNVIVVTPSAAGRGRRAKPVWLGSMLHPAAIRDVADWVEAGGPGIAEQPDDLDLHAFNPAKR